MAKKRSPERLRQLLISETVVDLPRIESALGGVSPMTAFRYLRQLPYRRSYNHNGRYYCLHEPSRYDRFGLWNYNNIHFSVDGSLGKTVQRLVYEMAAGATHRELQERLRVRVHNTLLTLLRQGEVDRERVAQVYVYLHPDPVIRRDQIERRQALIAAAETASFEVEVDDRIIIEVLRQHKVQGDLRILLRELRQYRKSRTFSGRFGPGPIHEDFPAQVLWLLEGEGKKDPALSFQFASSGIAATLPTGLA